MAVFKMIFVLLMQAGAGNLDFGLAYITLVFQHGVKSLVLLSAFRF